ncbi:MAG: glycosyltransferase family 2 protein [Burkholderiales bacterium]
MMQSVEAGDPAPIALFVFRRPDHTRNALDALAANPEWQNSPLYIYCDAARGEGDVEHVQATRRLVQAYPHPRKQIVEATTNKGLAASVSSGVSELCDRHGRVIVVEDDLVVSPRFLGFMNRALHRYSQCEEVMQISGHMFPVSLSTDQGGVFLPFTTTWGWATWKRAWIKALREPNEALRLLADPDWRRRFDIDSAYPYARMLTDQVRGRRDSWGIWWYFQVFRRNGLTLYPVSTLVRNDGFDGSGTNCGTWRDGGDADFDLRETGSLPQPTVDREALRVIRAHLLRGRGLPRRVKDTWLRMFPALPETA